jgi:hypothetical protein
MKRILKIVAFLCFVVAVTVAVMVGEDSENEGEFIKSFRDPERVDK